MFDKKVVLCLGCMHSGNNTDNNVAKLLDKVSIQVAGKPVGNICYLINSDGIIIGAYKVFDM